MPFPVQHPAPFCEVLEGRLHQELTLEGGSTTVGLRITSYQIFEDLNIFLNAVGRPTLSSF